MGGDGLLAVGLISEGSGGSGEILYQMASFRSKETESLKVGHFQEEGDGVHWVFSRRKRDEILNIGAFPEGKEMAFLPLALFQKEIR